MFNNRSTVGRLLGVVGLALTTSIWSAEPIRIDLPAAIESARQATVNITARNGSRTSYGAGVILDSTGIIVTARHVVHGFEQIVVTTRAGKSYTATCQDTNRVWDLAMLQAVTTERLPDAKFGMDIDPNPLEAAYLAVGNPGGTGQETVLSQISPRGMVTLEWAGTRCLVQAIKAPILPGYSGGGFFEAETGLLNGIIVAKSPNTVGVGYVVPMWQVQLYGIARATRRDGELPLGSQVGAAIWNALGLSVSPVPLTSAQLSRGLYVCHVRANTPGAAAGLTRGDLLVGADKYRLQQIADFGYVLQHARDDRQETPVFVIRGPQRLKVSLPMPKLSDEHYRVNAATLAYIRQLGEANTAKLSLDPVPTDAIRTSAVTPAATEPAVADTLPADPAAALPAPPLAEPPAFPAEAFLVE